MSVVAVLWCNLTLSIKGAATQYWTHTQNMAWASHGFFCGIVVGFYRQDVVRSDSLAWGLWNSQRCVLGKCVCACVIASMCLSWSSLRRETWSFATNLIASESRYPVYAIANSEVQCGGEGGGRVQDAWTLFRCLWWSYFPGGAGLISPLCSPPRIPCRCGRGLQDVNGTKRFMFNRSS